MFLKRFFKFIPRNDYSKALDLFNEGHYRKALAILDDLMLREVTDENLDMPTIELFACESHVALSKESLNEGDLSEALLEMERAVSLKPGFADLRYQLGTLYMDSGRVNDATKHFEKALGINAKYFKARVSLARAQHAAGETNGAVESLDVAKDSCPKFYADSLSELTEFLKIHEDEDSIKRTFHELLEERPSSAQVSREVAVEAIQNGNNAEAIRELKKAIALKPDYPDLHNYLGIAYGNHGVSGDAIKEFEVALKINPYYMKARLNLALALYDCDRYEEAQTHIEHVLSVKPENQLALNLLTELEAVMDRK